MAGRKLCSYCGKPVGAGGYCTSCRLHQDFLRKAGNTSLYYYNIGLDRARVHDLTGAMDALKMSLRYNKTNVEARNLLGQQHRLPRRRDRRPPDSRRRLRLRLHLNLMPRPTLGRHRLNRSTARDRRKNPRCSNMAPRVRRLGLRRACRRSLPRSRAIRYL